MTSLSFNANVNGKGAYWYAIAIYLVELVASILVIVAQRTRIPALYLQNFIVSVSSFPINIHFKSKKKMKFIKIKIIPIRLFCTFLKSLVILWNLRKTFIKRVEFPIYNFAEKPFSNRWKLTFSLTLIDFFHKRTEVRSE